MVIINKRIAKPTFRKVFIMNIEKEFLNGTPIVINNYITKTVRRRTHKKRRIDKKWLKKYGYKEVQDESKVYMIEGKLFMSQKCYDKIRTLAEKGEI